MPLMWHDDDWIDGVHHDPDTPTPLTRCYCVGCRSEGRLPSGPDCIHR